LAGSAVMRFDRRRRCRGSRQRFSGGSRGGDMDVPEAAAACSRVVDEVGGAVVADREFLDRVTLGILARGHVLLEDGPAPENPLGAIVCGRARLRVLAGSSSPPTLPQRRDRDQRVRRGRRLLRLLARTDLRERRARRRINRAPPKTQAALLEAMEEGQVTVDGETHDLPDPFYVIATQNPVESEGRSRFPRPNSTGSRSRPRSATPATRARSNCSDGARVASSRRRRSSACSIRTPSPASARCRRGSASTTIC